MEDLWLDRFLLLIICQSLPASVAGHLKTHCLGMLRSNHLLSRFFIELASHEVLVGVQIFVQVDDLVD